MVPRRGRFRQRLVALIDELLDDPPAHGRELSARRPGHSPRRLSRRPTGARVGARGVASRGAAGGWALVRPCRRADSRAARRSCATCSPVAMRCARCEPNRPRCCIAPTRSAIRRSSPCSPRASASISSSPGAATAERAGPPATPCAGATRVAQRCCCITCRPMVTSSAARSPTDAEARRSAGDASSRCSRRARRPASRSSSTAPTTTRDSATQRERAARRAARRRRSPVQRRSVAPLCARRRLTAVGRTALLDAAAGRTLPVVVGELRDSYGYTWTLQGTLGTRAHAEAHATPRSSARSCATSSRGSRSTHVAAPPRNARCCGPRGARCSRASRTTRCAAPPSTPSQWRWMPDTPTWTIAVGDFASRRSRRSPGTTSSARAALCESGDLRSCSAIARLARVAASWSSCFSNRWPTSRSGRVRRHDRERGGAPRHGVWTRCRCRCCARPGTSR